MRLAVPTETFPGERRVALVPASVPGLIKSGFEVLLEAGAGAAAGFPDAQYAEKGAKIVTRAEAFAADCVLQVRTLGANPVAGQGDLPLLRKGQVLIGMCDALSNLDAVKQLAATGATVFALELMPRTTRAQSMDVLSSQATIAGYRAVLLAATHLPKIFPMLTTAAGTITPAKVLIMGAGVAGLQAIATARRLGAVVSAYDVRAVVKEQIQSLGGKFIELDLDTKQAEGTGGYAAAQSEDFLKRQQELLGKVVAEQDVVITTALIPGKPAPTLVTAAMARGMQPGSVIVDLAAERGGNCELTKPGETVVDNGITILGPANLPSDIPHHASQMFAKNITTFLGNMWKDGQFNFDLNDEITRGTIIAKDGEAIPRPGK